MYAVVDVGAKFGQGCVSLKESQLASPNLVKSPRREIGILSSCMALQSYRRLRNITAEPPVKVQSHSATRSIDLATSRLDEIC